MISGILPLEMKEFAAAMPEALKAHPKKVT